MAFDFYLALWTESKRKLLAKTGPQERKEELTCKEEKREVGRLFLIKKQIVIKYYRLRAETRKKCSTKTRFKYKEAK